VSPCSGGRASGVTNSSAQSWKHLSAQTANVLLRHPTVLGRDDTGRSREGSHPTKSGEDTDPQGYSSCDNGAEQWHERIMARPIPLSRSTGTVEIVRGRPGPGD
jgi:hypothetical protein